MSKSFKQITQDINQALLAWRRESADAAVAGFSPLAKAAMARGVLSELHKELIALVIGVSTHCDGCIGFHVKTLVRPDAAREQLNEHLAAAI